MSMSHIGAHNLVDGIKKAVSALLRVRTTMQINTTKD
jgi:hypothetical protein